MLTMANYEGCGACRIKSDCRGRRIKVFIVFKKDEFWDNQGRMVKVFRKGDSIVADAYIKDDVVYCVSAESTIYPEISDFIDLDSIEVILSKVLDKKGDVNNAKK